MLALLRISLIWGSRSLVTRLSDGGRCREERLDILFFAEGVEVVAVVRQLNFFPTSIGKKVDTTLHTRCTACMFWNR